MTGQETTPKIACRCVVWGIPEGGADTQQVVFVWNLERAALWDIPKSQPFWVYMNSSSRQFARLKKKQIIITRPMNRASCGKREDYQKGWNGEVFWFYKGCKGNE